MRFHWSKAMGPLLALLVPCLVFGTPYDGAQWTPGHLIVNFKASVGAVTPVTLDDGIVSIGIPSIDELLAIYRVNRIQRLVPDGILARMKYPPDFGRLFVLIFPETIDVLPMFEDFEANSYVKYAHPDLLKKIYRSPNDPYWPQQWDKIQMGCNMAWDYTTGDSTIIVCAIDTGTDWSHPDLTPNLWVNPGEDVDGDHVKWVYDDIPGDPDDQDRLDNDGNGYVDDLIGWDFVDNNPYLCASAQGEDCDTPDWDPFGLEPHGTHCLGLMAARGNNGIGVAGTGWNFTAMAIRAGYRATDGMGYMSATVPAIIYATAMGAKIITMSYGSTYPDPSERDAIEAAWNNGCLLFGAAGNEPTEVPHYPACHPYVISVASTDNGDHLSYWSNRGTWLDLCAPGGSPGCWSTVIDGYGGGDWQGTSMATPNAGGTAALIWTLMPELTNSEMQTVIFNSCEDISAQNPGIDPAKLGNGRISAPNVLQSQYPHLSFVNANLSGDNDGDGRLERNETGNLVVTVMNDPNWAAAINVRGRIRTDDPHLSFANDSLHFGDLEGGETADNASVPFVISADGAIAGAYWAQIALDLTTQNHPNVTLSFQLRIERPPLLFVDDDNGGVYDAQFEADFDCLKVVYDRWEVLENGALDAAAISEYQEIFWSCGNENSATLTNDDQTILATFLDGGGKFALVGRMIDRDLYDDAFYANYLHCQTEGLDSVGGRQLTGVAGDEITNGTSLLLAGSCSNNGHLEQSRIVPLAGASVIFTYNGNRGNGAIRYGDSTTYQVVYCAFSLEACCGSSGTTHHRVIVQRILEWFGHPMSGARSVPVSLPENYALLGSFPNPFNPLTTIRYDVRAPRHVALKVYDIQGRLVETLFDGTAQVGSHSIRFDASSLASGIYFVRMTAPAFADTRKMVFLK